MPTLKFLCIGDSITAGDEANPIGYRSYRGALQAKLAASGYTVDFVGRAQSTPASGGTDPDHEGYGGAYISDAGVGALNASNNINDRIAAMKTALGAVDAIFLLVGWNDVYNQPSTAGARYTSLVSTVQSGVWASTKLFLFTLHPERNKTAAQTSSDNAAWQPINDAARAAVAGRPTTRYLVDLANLSGTGDAAAMLETLLFDAMNAPDFLTRKGGSSVPSPLGGHLVTSFKSMQDYNANWSTNVAVRNGPNGNANDMLSDTSVAGHPNFINGVQSVIPWLWMFAAPGHASSNTVIEARNMFAQARRKSTGAWDFFFEGARPGASGGGDVGVYDLDTSLATTGLRGDGITSWYRCDGNTMIETWPYDTAPSRGIEAFLGGRNRALMADADAFCWGVQVRLALLDPNGANDLSLSRLVACCGADFGTGFDTYFKRYDAWGWPLTMMDGGHDRWKRISSTDWVWVGGITLGRNTASWLGANSTEHYEDPGLQPPLANWSPATPYNNTPTYSLTPTQLRATPPKLPRYVTGNATSAGGWASVDYFDSIHMSQQGADKTAQAVFDALLASGVLGGGTGGPVGISLLPGIAAVGNWAARYVTEATSPATATWGATEVAQNSAPVWSTQGLPVAVQGVAYSAPLSAIGVPTPTFSIVSGAPTWASISGAALVGTPPTGTVPPTRSVTLRATNSVGSADVTFDLVEVSTMTITTTTLQSAQQNVSYLQQLAAAGVGPFTWSVSSGTLPAGLTLSAAGILSGTPTTIGSSTFTVRADGAGGQFATRAFTLAVAASTNAPAITSTTLADGVVGTAYSQTINATGASPRTWAITAGYLPAGLTLNTSTGVISGTPTAPGGYPITVSMTNAFGTVATQLSIRIASTASGISVSPWAKWLKGR